MLLRETAMPRHARLKKLQFNPNCQLTLPCLNTAMVCKTLLVGQPACASLPAAEMVAEQKSRRNEMAGAVLSAAQKLGLGRGAPVLERGISSSA